MAVIFRQVAIGAVGRAFGEAGPCRRRIVRRDRLKLAPTPSGEPAEARPRGQAEPAALADSDLAEYHRHYPRGSEAEGYFRLTRSIVLAGRRWRKLADKRIRLLGQSMARWETLFLVAFSGDARTQRELASLISIEGPTLVRMLDVLAQEGLIERFQNGADRRMTTNRMTPAGDVVVAQIKDVTDALRIDVLRGLDPADPETCRRVLAQIIARLDELN